MINNRIVISICLLSAAALAHAETTKLSEIEAFEQERKTILEDINSGVIYSEISHKDANLVREALNQISEVLSTVDDPRDLDQEKLVTLYNRQNLVNTILTMAENDSRQVCRRRGRLGTHFKTTTCETVAERRERQEADRMAIDRIRKSDMPPVIGPGTIGGGGNQ